MGYEDLHPLDTLYSYKGPYKNAVDVATHYGFALIKPPRVPKEVRKEFSKRETYHQEFYVDPVHKTVCHMQLENESYSPQKPLMACQTIGAQRKGDGGLNLFIIGSKRGIAEALIIQTALSTLREYGKKNLVVDINSLGDRASYKNFLRDYGGHFRKHITTIGDCCRTRMKNDLSILPECGQEPCSHVRNEAPRTINYLSEAGREHFKNVLEYMEVIDAPYRINCDLIGENPQFGTQTLFVIKEQIGKGQNMKERVVARGERFNRFVYNKQSRKNIPTVCANIDLSGTKSETYKELNMKKVSVPNFYLIHLGTEAKRMSLTLLELLRKNNISIAQSLVHDGLTDQIERAHKLEIPYTIILGVKEVKDNAVIVRNVETRHQDSVPIPKLLTYLRRIERKM